MKQISINNQDDLYPKIPQVNEMRIGNIMLDYEHNIVKVERINSDRIYEYVMVSQNDGNIYPSNIYKIPITEEWLKKLGFIKDTEINYKWFKLDTSIAFYSDNYCVRISDSWELGKKMYVSDMQNLFFALTGNELSIETQ